jgi:hypothetical protein
MKLKKFQPLLEVLIAAFLCFGIHNLFFYYNQNNPNYQHFHFDLTTIYSFFLTCSIIIILLLLLVKQKNIDNVGFTFLFATCLKIGISFALLMPILNSKISNIGYEKINFFIVFAIFLTIETVVTIRILNNNQ